MKVTKDEKEKGTLDFHWVDCRVSCLRGQRASGSFVGQGGYIALSQPM